MLIYVCMGNGWWGFTVGAFLCVDAGGVRCSVAAGRCAAVLFSHWVDGIHKAIQAMYNQFTQHLTFLIQKLARKPNRTLRQVVLMVSFATTPGVLEVDLLGVGRGLVSTKRYTSGDPLYSTMATTFTVTRLLIKKGRVCS